MFSQSLGLSKKFGSGNACIEGGKFKSVPLGEQEEMGFRGANSRATPIRPLRCTEIVRKKLMKRAEGCQHAPEHLCRLLHRNAPGGTLDGNPDKTHFRNGRGK